MRKFVKLSENRYLVKDSNGVIVSKEEVADEETISNERVKGLVGSEYNAIKKTKHTKKVDCKTKPAGD